MSETRSSEQVGFEIYSGLSAPDRKLVDAWRALGNDLVTSLLNSGAMGSSRRTHPSSAGRPGGFEGLRRLRPLGAAQRGRLACEHEAAHAQTALALGWRLGEVGVEADGSGCTEYRREDAGNPIELAAVCLAAEIWICDFRAWEFPGGDPGCRKDRRKAAGLTDGFGLERAARRAREILRANHAQVLVLADQIERDGVVDLSAVSDT